MKKPRLVQLLLGLAPFVAMCFSVALWDRVYPMILGMPFNLAWLVGWTAISTLCLWAAYRLERKNGNQDGGDR